MEILKVETETSFFGLRQRVRFLVAANNLDGQPEDFWMYATEHNIRYMAEQLNKAHLQLANVKRQMKDQPRRQLIITLKELSATVADAVERGVSSHPAIHALLDKVGGFARGGIVDNRAGKRALGDELPHDHHKASTTATERLTTRTMAPVLEINLLDENTDPSDVARQIRMAAETSLQSRATPISELVPNTSLEPVQPVEGISANREDRLSPND